MVGKTLIIRALLGFIAALQELQKRSFTNFKTTKTTKESSIKDAYVEGREEWQFMPHAHAHHVSIFSF